MDIMDGELGIVNSVVWLHYTMQCCLYMYRQVSNYATLYSFLMAMAAVLKFQ